MGYCLKKTVKKLSGFETVGPTVVHGEFNFE